MPWQGDPRVDIQNHKGMAKAYQVKQVRKAIESQQRRKILRLYGARMAGRVTSGPMLGVVPLGNGTRQKS